MLSPRAFKVTALACSAVLSACSPLKAVDIPAPDGGFERREGLAYGPEERQKLDVYRPVEPDAKKTVVIFLYGGGWKSGARALTRR